MNAKTTPDTNPLLSPADLPRFDAIRPEHIGPAIDVLLADANARLVQATSPIERTAELLDRE